MLPRVFALLAAVLVLVPAAGATTLTRAEDSLLAEMNNVRASHGASQLQLDARLERASRFHTAEMLRTGSFEHGAFGARMVRFDIQGSLAGENLAWGVGRYGSARGIVAAWLASPEHRASLLSPTFRRVGIGALRGPFAGFVNANVVTADFAG